MTVIKTFTNQIISNSELGKRTESMLYKLAFIRYDIFSKRDIFDIIHVIVEIGRAKLCSL